MAVARTSVASLKKKLDAVFSQYIRYRDGEIRNGEWWCPCITCGIWKPLKSMQNGHFVSRSSTVLRYDEENCNSQCPSCNVFRHGDLYVYGLKIDQKYGDGTAAKLHRLGKQTHKFTIPELEALIADYSQQVRDFQDAHAGVI